MVDLMQRNDALKTSDRTVFIARILVAIGQALALFLLADAAHKPISWPASEQSVFIPLLLLSVYLPLIVLFGIGQISTRSLALWAIVAGVVIAGLGYHATTRGQVPAYSGLTFLSMGLALTASLFIAHAIFVDSIIEWRLLPPYPRHFDTAWKQGVQACLALIFVGVFWGVLGLGAGLFKLLDIDFFWRLIANLWFALPATTLAFAVSVHVTDIQPALIRGARSLALSLFSWLLPLLTIIILGFLGSLPFISLAPLWRTHFATTLLLTAAGLLIFFINCCYQGGAAEQTPSKVKRFATTIAALELLPLVALAAWALSLRVGQYGWTVQRITAAAVVVVAICYAVGYASAVVRSTVWMKRIEVTNVLTAYVIVGVVLALYSPVADPSRLMVANQLDRLMSGKVHPDVFDFAALKYDGARWGATALSQLSQIKDVPDAEVINKRSAEAISSQNRLLTQLHAILDKPEKAAERILVYPAGRALPANFFDGGAMAMSGSALPVCLTPAFPKCVVRFVALSPGGPESILFIDKYWTFLVEQDAQGAWRKTADITGPATCESLRQGLAQQDLKLEAHTWPDLVVSGQRLTITPMPGSCLPHVP